MDVIINEVTASVRMVDGRKLVDPDTLAAITRAVVAAIETSAATDRRRRAETRVEDDGRGGLGGASGDGWGGTAAAGGL